MYEVDISNKDGYTFEVNTKDYSFTVDAKGLGASPPDVLCISTVYQVE
jgi:hypothetical protein